MEYASLTWNDVRFHNDRLRELSYPLSRTCHEWTLICVVYTDCRSFVFDHDLSPCVTYDWLFTSAASSMPLVEQDLIYHHGAFGSNSSCMGSCCSNFSFLMWTIVCLLFPLSLWPFVGSGYTNVVFRLSFYLLIKD